MKIISKAPLAFPLADGTVIKPGMGNYRKLDTNNKAVLYQLGLLKADKLIDFRENIPQPGIDVLPIMEDVEVTEEEEPANVKPVRRSKKKTKGS